jgi:hypothetical protein
MRNHQYLRADWASVYRNAKDLEGLTKAEDSFNSLLERAFKREVTL